MSTTYSQCWAIHETHLVTFTGTLESSQDGYVCKSSFDSTVRVTSELVVTGSEHFEQLLFSTKVLSSYIDHRCKSLGVGRTPQSFFIVQGRCLQLKSLRLVNLLDLEVVILAVKHFLPFLKNQNVLIRTENTTVMHYINKQGGMRSHLLCHTSWDLWNLVLKNNIQIKTAHIMGKQNHLADLLSGK